MGDEIRNGGDGKPCKFTPGTSRACIKIGDTSNLSLAQPGASGAIPVVGPDGWLTGRYDGLTDCRGCPETSDGSMLDATAAFLLTGAAVFGHVVSNFAGCFCGNGRPTGDTDPDAVHHENRRLIEGCGFP